MPPAARVTDPTAHGTPLTPSLGSPAVLIGFMPAWRALPSSVALAVESVSNAAKQFMQTPVLTPANAAPKIAQITSGLGQAAGQAAGAGNPAAVGASAGAATALNTTNVALTATWTAASPVPGGQPAANTAYTEGIKAAMAAATSAVFSAIAGMTDTHVCPLPCPIPPHGPGVVTKGSRTVFIDNLPATRQGDKVFEACGGEDPIAMGCPTVLIGDQEGSAGGGGAGGAGAAAEGAEAPPATPDEAVRQSVVEAITTQGPAVVSDVSPAHVGPLTPASARPQRPTWLGVYLKDFDEQPIANEDLVVTLDDGQVLPGRTDQEGYIKFEGLQPGQGVVSFAKILDDKSAPPMGLAASGETLDEGTYTRAPEGAEPGPDNPETPQQGSQQASGGSPSADEDEMLQM